MQRNRRSQLCWLGGCGSQREPRRIGDYAPFCRGLLRKPQPPVVVALVLAIVLCCATQAHAVFVLKKGSTKPLLGYLVKEDAAVVIVREPLKEGGFREHTIPRAEIDELVITVSPERLGTLDPKEPQRYREYAEELAEKQRDPEAREAALRLFHTTAWLAEGPLRKSALLGMIALARSPDELRKFRAAAYLHDPEHDWVLLAAVGEVPVARAGPTREPLADLLVAMKSLRQGMVGEARTIFEKPASREGLASLDKIVTPAELLAACGAKQLSDEQLRKVLLAEIALQRALSEEAAQTPEEIALRQTSWSQAVRTGGLAPLPPIDLATLTEFDPRACLFRGGKWVRP